MSWTLIEPCCGAASIATHLCGSFKRTLLPYQGSKWKLRKAIQELLVERGFTGAPRQTYLSDIGPWGKVWQGLLDPVTRNVTLAHLDAWVQDDPREVYDRIHNHSASEDLGTFTAEYLFLQRLAFGGKAVAPREGIWKSPGFNTTSAYGLPAKPKFGAVNPMIPSLIRTLHEFKWETMEGWFCQEGSATDLRYPIDERTVVYFDPPYSGTTLYPAGDLPRSDVVRLAEEWSARGAFVIVSEGTAIEELGWESCCLIGSTNPESIIRGNSTEWITYNQARNLRIESQSLESFFGMELLVGD